MPVPLPLQNHEKYFAKKPRNRSYFDSNPLYDFFNELNSECITPTTCQHSGNFLVPHVKVGFCETGVHLLQNQWFVTSSDNSGTLSTRVLMPTTSTTT